MAQSQSVEIESTDSGILLPRLADTTSVVNPEEGLLIYDLNDKNPSYYDGTKWMSAFSSSGLGGLGDSLTYTVSTSNARMVKSLQTGTFPLSSFSWGMSSNFQFGGNPVPNGIYQDIAMGIPIDLNWIPFQDHLIQKTAFDEEIVIDIYESGSSAPLYSIKLKGGTVVTSVQFGSGSSGMGSYSLTLAPLIVGIKHHPSDMSIGVATREAASY